MARRSAWRPWAGLALALALVAALAVGLAWGPALAGDAAVAPAPASPLGKADMAALLAGHLDQVAQARPFEIKTAQLGPVIVRPALDLVMQERAKSILARLRSKRAGLVVLEASTGRVLVLAGWDHGRFSPEVALRADAPAASLFKMVTAAAALEEVNLDPSTRLSFAGRPHTLFKYQLKERTRRHEQVVTLCESFADSNNPIFARLGVHQLGGDLLLWYARALGFDRPLAFDLPVEVSQLPVPTDDFQVGELACGFQRHTTTSPLHAALMVSTFVAGGHIREPWAVERATAGGRRLYTGQPNSRGKLVSADTCTAMRELFEATVSEGTARKAFRRVGRDKVLKDLQIGGKTGTLRGPDRTELFEWFAGYGRDPATGRTLAVCTLVVHGKQRFDNPKQMARRMLKEAFLTSRAEDARRMAAGRAPKPGM